jgi:excisionase family DNA binding protein
MQGGGAASPAAVAAPAGVSATATAAGLEVLTPEQAAQLLGVPVGDVMTAINAGQLKARQIGSAWRIARSALETFLHG